MSLSQLAPLLELTCPAHPTQPLNLFSFSQQIPSPGLICSLCQPLLPPQKQTTLPLKIILKNIQKDLQTFSSNSTLAPMAAQLDYNLYLALNLIDNMKTKSQAELLRSSVTAYFQKLGSLLMKPKAKEIVHLLEISTMRSNVEKTVTLKEVNQFLISYSQLYKETKPTKDTCNYILYLESLIEDLAQKHLELDKAIRSNTKLQLLYQIYCFTVEPTVIIYHFSPTLKNTSHLLSTPTHVIQQNNYNTNFSLIQPSIQGTNKYSSSIKTIKIKIVKMPSWIALGICHGNLAKSANYYFNTATVGHGAYMVSNDGYSWHHGVSTLNSFYNSWGFDVGDVVKMVVNLKTKMIKWTKEGGVGGGGDAGYEMGFEVSATDKLYFAVSLSSHQEAVEIVNE